jgi:hypothetical protein
VFIPAVEIFVDWLYTMMLPKAYYDWINDAEDRCGDFVMMEACAFAQRLIAPKFLEAAEHKIIAMFLEEEHLPHNQTVVFAFENLPCTSPVLRLVVDSYYLHYNKGTHAENKQDGVNSFPNEFLVAFMLRHLEVKESRICEELDACDYHEHESDAERDSCRI